MALDSYYPARTSSRMPAPGIFVNVEFGVSFSDRDRPHTAALKYTSKNMQERLARQRRQQEERLLQARNYQPQGLPLEGQHPAMLTPGPLSMNQPRHHQPSRSRRLVVRTREPQAERGSSAPPTLSDRNQPISPVSPISGIQHTSSMPLSGMERPLPALPSQFRLGEDGLPWSTEPWYVPQEPYASPTLVGIELENMRGEDPQRIRELEALHQAMMTVDSLPNDGWESWTWDSVGDMPRGPRSIGWAVSTNDSPSTFHHMEPPSYAVSQWDQLATHGTFRPRSAGR